MSPLELKTYPDPCLRIKTKPVERFDAECEKMLRSMAEIMHAREGIGLAATQVGLGSSVFVVDIGGELLNFINPVILERSKEKSVMEEGCLSLPGVLVSVKRPEKVKVRAQNREGDFFIRTYGGLTSRAIQHEIDHLRGKLIIDYLNPIRHLIAIRRLAGSRYRQTGKTCEVVCNVGKEDTGSP